MIYQRLTSSARLDGGRQRLIHPAWVLGFGAAVLLTLVAVFPFKRLSEQLLHADLNQALAERYIIVLLKTDPGNADLRLTLIRQLIRNGKLDEAAAWLETVRAGDRGTDYEIARLELQLARVRQLPRDDPNTRQSILETLAQLATASLGPQQLDELGDMAAALHDAALALRFYRRLARTDAGMDSRVLASKGETLLGLGQYRLAAELYFLAQENARRADERLRLLLRGVRILQAGGLLKEAVAEGEQRGGEFMQQRDYLVFMIRLALAANDPAAADRFSRRLLSISWLEKLRLAAMPQFRPVALGGGSERLEVAPALLPRTFDEEVYSLAWQAFLANRNLKDAWRVAASAVKQQPDSLLWRERLAQVSEWTQRPREALDAWLWLARKTNAEQAWQGVLRLAPGLFDYDALLQAYRHEVASGRGNPALWQRIAESYEYLGDARAGLAYLEQLLARRRDPELLRIIAGMAQRLGDAERALSALQEVRRLGRDSEDLAVREAVLHVSAGRLEAAYAALTGLPEPSPAAAEYWQLRAELARLLAHDDDAVAAYRVLHASGVPRLQDTQNLVALLAARHPLEAAQLAEAGWRRSQDATLYLQALSLYEQAQAWRQAGRLLEEARGPLFDALREQDAFWRLKAAWAEHAGDLRQARESWETALVLVPDDDDIKVALLWLLIQQQDRSALARRLVLWREDARRDGRLADAFSAAHAQLGEPEQALAWAQSQLPAHREDFLWLMNYADLLDLAHRQELAQRLRWALWRQRQLAGPALADRTVRTGVVRLALLYQPGDRAESVLRHALRQAGNESLAPELRAVAERDSRNADELALGHFLSQEASDRAAAWLLARHAQRVAAPDWAASLLALQTGDTAAQARLLDEERAIPLYDRIYAARGTGRVRLAQTLAFDGMVRYDWDDTLHQQLFETALPLASAYTAGGMMRDDGNIETDALRLGFAWQPEARWRLGLALERGRDRVVNAHAVLLRGPLVDGLNAAYGLSATYDQLQLTGLSQAYTDTQAVLTYRHDEGETALRLGARCRFDCQAVAGFMHATRIQRLDAQFRLDFNQPATESAQLRLLGEKDSLQARLQWNFSRREYLAATLQHDRYGLEGGEALGAGTGVMGEAGWRIRTEYPNFMLRLNASQWRFSDTGGLLPESALPLSAARWNTLARIDPSLGIPGTALSGVNVPSSAFLPQNFAAYGINFGFGENVRRDYSRAWRPYLDLGIGRNSVTGLTWNWLAGVAGSVIGGDHLTAYLGGAGGGQASAGRAIEAGVHYTYFFDR
ncbi:MAG: tetratricopeptide repeat protein [Thiobacillus sp.]